MDWQYHAQEIVWQPRPGSPSESASLLAKALQAHRPTGWVRHGSLHEATVQGAIGLEPEESVHAALLANGRNTILARHGHPDPALQRFLLQSCDLVVVEGDVGGSAPRIVELDDEGNGLERLSEADRADVVALVGRRAPTCPLPPGGVPRFPPEDVAALAEHLLDVFETRARSRPPTGLFLSNPDDRPETRQASLRALRAVCDRVLHVGPDESLERGGIEIVPSNHPAWGDAGRILSAFEAQDVSALVVLDSDEAHAARLERLFAGRDVLSEATAFRARDTHMPDPGASIWEPRARQRLAGMLAIGIACPRRTLVQASTRLLDP